MKYQYYVSYVITNGNQSLTTARLIDSDEMIKTIANIEVMARNIARAHGVIAAANTIVILGWHLLEKPQRELITNV